MKLTCECCGIKPQHQASSPTRPWRGAPNQPGRTCCHLQRPRSGFFYKHHPQPKSDLSFIYLSQQSHSPVSVMDYPSRDCFTERLSEDEALQRALELSLAETKPQVPRYLLPGERGWDMGKGSVW